MRIGFDSFLTRRRQGTPTSDPTRVFPRVEWTVLPVAVEYLSLYKYLEHRYASMVVLTFDQIETLLGFDLPASARCEPDWWTNAEMSQAHSSAWTRAGRTAVPNLRARTVAFERLL